MTTALTTPRKISGKPHRTNSFICLHCPSIFTSFQRLQRDAFTDARANGWTLKARGWTCPNCKYVSQTNPLCPVKQLVLWELSS